jgi:D-glycero-D-manno-heptose 1,7-bisphosphate phosphatase
MINQWKIDSSWSLFLDRDGVINKRIWDGYVLDFKDFIFKPNTVESLKFLTHFFSHTIIITNQQCVSKNLISVSELDEIHHQMLREINAKGGEITGIYAATEEKNKTPFRRKPNITMGLEAQKQFPTIDLSKSIMVGDTDSDIQFGKNLGMKTILMKSAEINTIKADLEISNLTELVDFLMK